MAPFVLVEEVDYLRRYVYVSTYLVFKIVYVGDFIGGEIHFGCGGHVWIGFRVISFYRVCTYLLRLFSCSIY